MLVLGTLLYVRSRPLDKIGMHFTRVSYPGEQGSARAACM